MTTEPRRVGNRAGEFLHAIQAERILALTLSHADMARIRAYMGRVEASSPGEWAQDPNLEASLQIAVTALLDRGLDEDEADNGLQADVATGRLSKRRTASWAVRAQRAWRVLRRGW